MLSKPDTYFKKTISFKYKGVVLQFLTSQSIFSSHDIDKGTQRLLRTLLASKYISKCKKILDLGCGYGPIGITLSTINKSSQVDMVDIDALSLKYAQENASLNNVKNIKIYPSLGYDDINSSDFDFIISNIPAKVGKATLEHMLKDAKYFLKPDGLVAIVVIDEIADQVASLLNDEEITIVLYKKWPGHRVYHYKFSKKSYLLKNKTNTSIINRRYYRNGDKKFSFGDLTIKIQPTYNLPEFDTPSFQTKLLINNLKALKKINIKKTIILNPNQGIIPIALSKIFNVKTIELVDRNLQALRVSKMNLKSNNYPIENIKLSHQINLKQTNSEKSDFIIGVIPEKENLATHEILFKQIKEQLTINGIAMIVSSTTVISRIKKLLEFKKLLKINKRKKAKGASLLVLTNY